jgi:hypothetical protein
MAPTSYGAIGKETVFGQSRYERLPKTQNWQNAVALLSSPRTSTLRVAGATANACRTALKRRSNDPVLVASLSLLLSHRAGPAGRGQRYGGGDEARSRKAAVSPRTPKRFAPHARIPPWRLAQCVSAIHGLRRHALPREPRVLVSFARHGLCKPHSFPPPLVEGGELIPISSPRPLGGERGPPVPSRPAMAGEDGTGGHREYQKPRVTQGTLCYPLKYGVGFEPDEED